MKQIFLLLLFFMGTCTVYAQNKTIADSLGTTRHGLPVHKSFVPPDAVERAKKKYGRALYSIEKSAAADCQQSYLVGLIRNGKLTMEWMCDDPKIAQATPKALPVQGVFSR